jgi:hypothetical protein
MLMAKAAAAASTSGGIANTIDNPVAWHVVAYLMPVGMWGRKAEVFTYLMVKRL